MVAPHRAPTPADSPTPGAPPLALIYAVTVTAITINTVLAPAIPDILASFGASSGLAGLLIGAATLPGVVLAPVIGLLADRFGRREVLIPCLCLFGIAGGLGGLAPSLGVLIALRLLQGAGSAGLINLAIVIIGDHWDGAQRARIIGRNAAALTISLALFPTIGGALTDLVGWRAVFAVYPIALITAGFIALRIPKVATRDVRLRDQITAAAPLLRTGRVQAILLITTVTFALIFGLILTVLPLYAEQSFGLGASYRGLLLGLPAVANTVAALSTGTLLGRFPRWALLCAAATLFAVAFAILAGASTVAMLFVGAAVFGFGEGLMLPNLQDMAAGAGSDTTRGTVVAVFVASSRVGQTVGPVTASGGVAAGGAPITFAAGAVVAAIMAAAIGIFGRPTAGSDRGPAPGPRLPPPV